MTRPTLPNNSADPELESARRKIRKGTQSCWQCKRRKIRCRFVTPRDNICHGCKLRKTTCVSQEFPEELSKRDNNTRLPDRLARLEDFVNRFVDNGEQSKEQGSSSSLMTGRQPPTLSPPCDRATQPSSQQAKTSNSVRFNDQHEPNTNWSSTGYENQSKIQPTACHPTKALSFESGHTKPPNTMTTSRFHDISSRLLEAWPESSVLQIILNLPAEVCRLYHATTYTAISGQRPEISLQQVLKAPLLGDHPVLIARKLLFLATCLQSLSPSSAKVLAQAQIDPYNIMSRAVDMVHEVVTSNDRLLETIEGLECLMIECMYQSNAGDLRGAWHISGRAILLAQMMGLHRRTTTIASVPLLDTGSRTRIDTECLWFRLTQMNRYLSMMLGLLQSTPNNEFADASILEKRSPVERMQRLDCAAGGYIIQRNEANLHDKGTTYMIDQMLRDSAANLPDSWWSIPDLTLTVSDQNANLEEVIRIIDQLTHFHLLTQLHLPHLLAPASEHEHDYSKFTALNSSREVLLRFTTLHVNHSFTSFCRGIGFLAFVACTTLCIAHIEAKRQRRQLSTNVFTTSDQNITSDNSVLNHLAAQYEFDHSLMSHTLASLNYLSSTTPHNPIATKTGRMLSHLLSLATEDTTTLQHYHHTSASNPNTERISATINNLQVEQDPMIQQELSHSLGLGCGGKLANKGQTLYIHIPYFGTTKFEKREGEGGGEQEDKRQVMPTLAFTQGSGLASLSHPFGGFFSPFRLPLPSGRS